MNFSKNPPVPPHPYKNPQQTKLIVTDIMQTESLMLELIAVQKRIATALENKPQVEDGFCDIPPSIKYIFLDGKHPTYWYTLNESGNKVDCPKRALAGKLQFLNLTTSLVAGEERQKLDTWLETSYGIYVIRTGWESHACKSLMLALVELPENLLKGQIILSPYKLSDKRVNVEKSTARDALFFDVWSDEGKVIAAKQSEPDSYRMIKQINFLLTGEAIASPKDKNKTEAPLPATVAPIRSSQLLTREQLMEQSGSLARDLGWNSDHGKEFLMKHYGVKGRTLLSDEQLMNFVARLQELVAIAS